MMARGLFWSPRPFGSRMDAAALSINVIDYIWHVNDDIRALCQW
jgi:hypothetical protein